MTEYIERRAVLALFDAQKWQGQICIEAVKEIPAAYVAPVVNGEWVESKNIKGVFNCSECHYSAVTFSPSPYCPKCGAKMY